MNNPKPTTNKMAKKKKSTRGGARPGAGRKETGINWRHIGFSVHKDDYEIIKELVNEKKKELNELRKSNGQPQPVVNTAEIPSCGDQLDKVIKQSNKTSKPVLNYLQKRRSMKSGS